MPYVVSTASNSAYYGKYIQGGADIKVRDRQILIKGGANVAQKDPHLFTPKGVATHVTDEELEFLESLPSFQRHKKAGFLNVVKAAKDPDKIAEDMKAGDESKPKSDGDYPDAPTGKDEKETIKVKAAKARN